MPSNLKSLAGFSRPMSFPAEIEQIDYCESMVGNVTGPEILIFTGICAGAIVAGYTVKKIIDYRKEAKLAAIAAGKDEQIVEKLTSTIFKALDVFERRDIQASVRKLIAKLDDRHHSSKII